MIRGSYAKIFLWFLFATGIMSAIVFVSTVVTHTRSLGPQWMVGVLDQYARSAVDIYLHGGQPRLREYLNCLAESSHLQATLLDPSGNDISHLGVPPGAEKVLGRARDTNRSQFHTGFIWTGASVVDGPDGKYILVGKVIIPYGFVLFGAVQTIVFAWLMPAVAGALICWLLARHLAKPIRALQSVAGRSRTEISPFEPLLQSDRGTMNWRTWRETSTGWQTAFNRSCAGNWSFWEISRTNCDLHSLA
jgi:hypothetical protein